MASDTNDPRMRLVGAMQIGAAAWDMNSFGALFTRLMKEVPHSGDLTRYVGYEGDVGEQVNVRFFGVEVERIDSIPDGMVAWDQTGDTWTILQPSDGRNLVLWRGNLTWQWFCRSALGRATGEFAARGPADWSDSDCDFRITTNAYSTPGKTADDDVYLVDYDPSWPRQFEEMAPRIQDELGPEVALRVEHYGSTAIPGMPAKPIVDVLVEIPSFAEARKRAIPVFDSPECEYWFYSGHMVFIIREKLMGRRTHHIHMAPAGHEIWQGLAFRDHLRTHPEDAARYVALKYELADTHRTDRESYTNAKEAFVAEVTARALREA